MNAHDSEKVVGTLLAEGYSQVETPEDAGLVLYNTCSIRDKAEQKVFNRLQQFKREAGKGKVFGVLGCVAQQEGEKIFERAPHVSLVAGSASYTTLRRDAGAARSRQPARHRPEPRYRRNLRHAFTRRDNPHRAYITIIEGCDKSCAYCVVPFTRGPERSRTSESVMAEARGLADEGYTEIQLLGQNVNSYRDPSPAGWDFATLLARVAEIPGIRRVRYTTSHPRDFVQRHHRRHGRQPRALRSRPPARAVRIVPSAGRHGPPLHARRVHAPHRVDEERAAALFHHHRHHRRLPRRDRRRISRRRSTCWTKCSTIRCSASSIRRGPTPPRSPWQTTSRRRRSSAASLILQEKQRAIQIRRNAELIGSVQRGAGGGPQPGARASGSAAPRDNRTLNFTHPDANGDDLCRHSTLPVRVTRAGPNSLVGESARSCNCGVIEMGRALDGSRNENSRAR